jgi:hypothetical protein
LRARYQGHDLGDNALIKVRPTKAAWNGESALSIAPLRCAHKGLGNARTRTAHYGIGGRERFCGWKGPGVRLMNDEDGLLPQAGATANACAQEGSASAARPAAKWPRSSGWSGRAPRSTWDRLWVSRLMTGTVSSWTSDLVALAGGGLIRRGGRASSRSWRPASPTPRGSIRSTGNWRPTGAGIAGAVTAAATGRRRSSGMGPSTTTPTAYARPDTTT